MDGLAVAGAAAVAAVAAEEAEVGDDWMDALGDGAHREGEDDCEAPWMEVEAKRVVAIVISD